MPTPPQVAVIQLQSPAFGDKLLVEAWNIEVQLEDVPYGQHHPDAGRWPNYRLVKQEAMDDKWVRRYWVADPAVENTYNLAAQEFDAEDVSKEIFIRHYLVRRTEYIPANIPAKLSLLTGIIGIRVTAGGAGYDNTTTVAFSGGAGSGAAATPIIFRGAVVGIYITAEGTSYTSAPTVTINGPVGSAGAAATARIQPPTAKLIKEKAERIEGMPDDGLYLKITRVYAVLPGAIVTERDFDEFGGTLTRTTQRVIATTIPTDEIAAGVPHIQRLVPESTVTATLHDEARQLDVIVKDIERVDASVPGSRATKRYYLVDASSAIPDDTETVTYERQRYPKDPKLAVEIKTTYVMPPDYREDVIGSHAFPTLFYSAQIVAGTGFGLLWRRREGFSRLVVFKHYHSFSISRVSVSPATLILASWTEPFGFSDTALTPEDPADRTYTFTDQDGNTFSDVLPASTPSVEDYENDWIGSEKIIGGRSEIWRAGIYKNTTIKVIMQ